MREAHHWLESEGRILTVNGDDGLTYVVFDFELQKRSKYEACKAWADMEDGQHNLWNKRRREMIPLQSDVSGRFGLHREARKRFKCYCDRDYGGEVWFGVINCMGGCPVTFVDAYNAVINQRLAVA